MDLPLKIKDLHTNIHVLFQPLRHKRNLLTKFQIYSPSCLGWALIDHSVRTRLFICIDLDYEMRIPITIGYCYQYQALFNRRRVLLKINEN